MPDIFKGMEKQNVYNDGNTRAAFVAQTTVPSGYLYLAGFSVEGANTGEVYHYLLMRQSSTGIGYLKVYTEQWRQISSINVGRIPVKVNLSYALQNRQLIINSPELSYPLYSIVGAGCTRATPVQGDDVEVSTLSIPTGHCCSFGDRVVIAAGSLLYFSDAGIFPRTFTAMNVVALPATIHDIFQGPQGQLVIGTADGVYSLARDALGQGQLVYGMIDKVSEYQCSQPKNIASADGQVIGLSKQGVIAISQNNQETPISTYIGKRYSSAVVGPGASGDYRNSAIFGTSDMGHLISIAATAQAYSVRHDMWYTSGLNLQVVGTLRAANGTTLLLTPSYVLEMFGNAEHDDSSFVSTVAGTIDVTSSKNYMVRGIITSSDAISYNISAYLAGSSSTLTVTPPPRAANIIGTSTWNTSNEYVNPEVHRQRHHFANRTNEVTLEIAVTEPASRLGPFDILTKEVASKRPIW